MKTKTLISIFRELTEELFPNSETGNPMGWTKSEVADFVLTHTEHKTKNAARLAMAVDVIGSVDVTEFERVRIADDIFALLDAETKTAIVEVQAEYDTALNA